MPEPARKSPQRQGSFNYNFTAVPRWVGAKFKSPGFIETLARTVSPACGILILLVQERTIGSGSADEAGPECWSTTEPELARTLAMTPQGVRKLIREAESCVHDDPDRAKRLGLLNVKATARGIELRFAFEGIPKLRPLRELKKLPTKEEREERRKVQALPAELTCPVGQNCPVHEVFLNGHVTNIAPKGVEIVREIGKAGEHVSPPVAHGRPAAAPNHGKVATGVAGSNGHGEVGEGATGVATSPANVQILQEAISPILFDLLGKPLDVHFARRLLDALTPATAEDLVRVVKLPPNLKRIQKDGSRVLLYLAKDLGEAVRRVRTQRETGRANREAADQQERDEEFARTPIEQVRETVDHFSSHPDAIGFARLLLSHPDCSDLDRDRVYRTFPGLRHEADPMFQDAAG